WDHRAITAKQILFYLSRLISLPYSLLTYLSSEHTSAFSKIRPDSISKQAKILSLKTPSVLSG
ncbi:hypothetical protein, partial [Arsenophonus sp.]|uniref:hypothetical protein n=1 Tax=Arsenophonus sp. TaxID=1872640 RepID=UPI00285673F8